MFEKFRLSFMLTAIAIVLMLCFLPSCSANEDTAEPETVDTQTETEVEEELEEEETVPEVFESVWPEVLPGSKRPVAFTGTRTADGRIPVDKSEVTQYFYDHISMWLYDFPDPFAYFSEGDGICILTTEKYGTVIEMYFRFEPEVAVTQKQYDRFIKKVKNAGYTDSVIEDERSYYCEKYGVAISATLDNKHYFEYDNIVSSSPTRTDRVCVRLYIIDTDYEMDLEAIKAAEYEAWQQKRAALD